MEADERTYARHPVQTSFALIFKRAAHCVAQTDTTSKRNYVPSYTASDHSTGGSVLFFYSSGLC